MRRLAILLFFASAGRADGVTDAADEALKAFRAKGDLKTLAAKDDPDPWLVADELCARGEHDAAAAFAKAAPRPDTEQLPTYVAAQRGRGLDAKAREALAAADRALRDEKVGDALAAIDTVKPETVDVVSIRLLHGRGHTLRAARRLEESADGFRRAGEDAERVGWLARAANAHYESGLSCYRHSDFKRALSCWEKRLAIEETRQSIGGTASARRSVGTAHYALSNYATALEHYKVSLDLAEKLGDRRNMAMALECVGNVHWACAQYPKALDCYERALELEQAVGDKEGAAWTLGNIGRVYHSLGNQAKALEYLERSLDLMSELRDRAGLMVAFRSVGEIRARVGDQRSALDSFERSLALARELGDRLAAAQALVGIGGVHEAWGDYPKALECHESALDLAERVGARRDAAMMLTGIGVIHLHLGAYPKALQCLQRALTLSEEVGNRAGVANALGNMGSAHYCLGNYAEALKCQSRALNLSEELGRLGSVARQLGNIGLTYYSLGNYPRALECQGRALVLARKVDERALVARVLGYTGQTHFASRDYSKALEFYGLSLETSEALGDQSGVAQSSCAIGSVHVALGEYVAALGSYERSLNLAEKVGDLRGAATALCGMGSVRRSLGDHAKALEHLERARTLAAQIGAADTAVRALWGIAATHLAAGRPVDAAAAARAALAPLSILGSRLAEEEGALMRERFAGVFEVGVQATLASGDTVGAAHFLESGRAATLAEGFGGRAGLLSTALPEELQAADIDARAKERAALARYRRALDAGEPIDRLWGDVEAAREAIVEVARRMRREAKAQADLVCPEAATLNEIKGVLRDGEALVLYAVFEEESIALLVTPSTARVTRLGPTNDIEGASGAVQRAAVQPEVRGVAAPAHERFDYLAKRLTKLLVEPLELDASTSRLLVSPDGPLAYVPFAALTGKEVVYVPSGTTYRMLLPESSARGTKVLAVGDPDYAGPRDGIAASLYGEKLEPLPASREEAKAVGDVVLLGKNATVGGLREALAGEPRWRAVHFACHGLIDPERPVLSSLALAAAGEDDGYLKCLDVFRMRMPADLVVLSACETAKGKAYEAEGVIGFVRAFMMAGSPRVVASLWKVDDRATRALMERFYAEWKGGKPAATALRRAQEFVASREEWRHPYFWAAWQLWGLGA